MFLYVATLPRMSQFAQLQVGDLGCRLAEMAGWIII
jgi:hypothetical protein